MYQSVEQIRKLREEKQAILRNVYRSDDPEEINANQRELGKMSVSIFTDVAQAILPALQEDGAGGIVWSRISLRLNKLSFISLPSSPDIPQKYQKSMEDPTVLEIHGAAPKPGTRIKVRKPKLPVFICELAAQGIAVPLLLHVIGGVKPAIVKILCGANAAVMVMEVVAYCTRANVKPHLSQTDQETKPVDDCKAMDSRAIREVYQDNGRKLDDWFDILEAITIEEIDFALGKAEV